MISDYNHDYTKFQVQAAGQINDENMWLAAFHK